MRFGLFQFSGWGAGLLTSMGVFAIAIAQPLEGALYLIGAAIMMLVPWLGRRKPEIDPFLFDVHKQRKRGYPQVYFPHSRSRGEGNK